MKRDDFNLAVDFVYRTWVGYVAFAAALVWRRLTERCIPTVVFTPVLGVLVVATIGTALYTIWTMARASTDEEYREVGGASFVLVLLVLSGWFALFCGEGG